MLFLEIFLSSILPLFILIGVGALVDRLFHLDIPTLSKLNFYVFSPVLLFTLIAESSLDFPTIIRIGGFLLATSMTVLLVAVLAFAGKWTGHRRPIMTLGSLFSNNVIFGLSVALLAFGDEAPGALAVLAVQITLQTILVYTFGILVVQGAETDLLGSVKALLRYPMLYAILLGVVFRQLSITLPEPIQFPLDQIRAGFLTMALIMLGAQLARSEILGDLGMVGVTTLMRLVVAPVIAFGIMITGLFQFEPLVREVLIVSAGFPVAVNVYVLAVEFDRAPSYASRIVFWSTLVSALTVTGILILLRQLG